MATAPDRWRRVQALCEALETVPPIDHVTRLQEMEPDASLRTETLALLVAVGQEERTRFALAARSSDVPDLPAQIGPYQIVQRIGVGGSGEVFRATRTVNGVEHDVALKQFHVHRSSPEHLDRFAREQQVLASLRHPDIVRFMDAGVTSDGRPYLVMDLADGEPITTHCEHHHVKLSQRLRLMEAVCEAVQSAHRQLVVHLDLKPSNILVSDGGRVKLLDFGTAKLIAPSSDGTRTQSLTVQYASPEQLRGEPVSAACDIYSLGLILYELVSGSWPFRRPETLISVAERAAGRLDPTPLDRERGDLDAICRKAIAHEPGDRYATAAELADDLRRFQLREPVRARPASTAYKLSRFARRHRWGVAAAGLLVTGLLTAAIYSTAQAREAQRASRRTESANQFLTSVLTLTGTDATSRNGLSVKELLALAEQRITPTLGDDLIVAADVEIALGRGFATQELYSEARKLFERARARASAAGGDVSRQVAASVELSYLMYLKNETAEAWREASTALEEWRRERTSFSPAKAAQVLAAGAKTMIYIRPTDRASRPYFEACLEIASPASRDVAPLLRADCLLGLATSYTMADSWYAKAEPLLEEALALERQDPTAMALMSTTLQMRGLVGRFQGRYADDERAQREAYEITARLLGADSMSATWQRAVWVLSLTGIDRADEAYREAGPLLDSARRHAPTPGSYMLWTPLIGAAAAACHAGQYGPCEAWAREALMTLGSTPAEDDTRLASARGFLGIALAATARCAEAKPLLENADASFRSRGRVQAQAPLIEQAILKCQ